GALALVLDRSPGLFDQEMIARSQAAELVGHAVMVGVDLDGEFEVVPSLQRREGEGPLLVAPALAVDRDVRRLAGPEFIAGRFLETEAANIVRHVLGVEDT